MKLLAIGLLSLVFLKCLLIFKTSKALPMSELRRRARTTKDSHDRALYKLLAFQDSLKLVILLLGTASGATLFLLAARVSGWLVAVLILIVSWMALDDRFVVAPGSWLWRISSYIAPAIVPILDFLQPLLSRIVNSIGQPKIHSGVYEREDLLELLDRQKSQIDNRVSEPELKAARGALTFGDKTVASVMSARKAVKWVSRDDPIGPKLMDDLHKTGQVRFPVIRSDSQPTDPEVIGTLYLTDLLKNLETGGKVGDIMKHDIHFINESHSLLQALDGFLKSGHHLLVVVNNFEEVVGILTLENVLSQILGQKIDDDFDHYHDKRAVAGHDPKSTQSSKD